MAFFDDKIECSDGSKKRVHVRGDKGASDRNIYVNGSSSGYRLGNGNNKIYTTSGREASSASIKDFAKQSLWPLNIRKPSECLAFLLNLLYYLYNAMTQYNNVLFQWLKTQLFSDLLFQMY